MHKERDYGGEVEDKGFNRRGIKTFPSEVVGIDLREIERWKSEHANDVHDAIKEIDRRDAESAARAPDIVVSNDPGGKK